MTDISTADLPTGWDAYVPLVTSVVRSLLTVLGGAGFTWALTVNASQIQMGVSAAMVVAGAVWSLYQKIQAQRALTKAAAQPAGVAAPKLPA